MAPESNSDARGEGKASSAFVDTMTHQPVDITTDDPFASLKPAQFGSTISHLTPATTPRRTVAHSTPATIHNAADYELLEKIGEGGMAVVYEGWQRSINRIVALKLSKSASPALSNDSATLRTSSNALFLGEAVLTGHLEHPNIIPIYDMGLNDQDELFYVMKRVRGTSWREVIRNKSVDENLDILLDVADAVAFAHSRRIVHQDIKPHNVMLGAFGEVLLTDWGLAFSIPEETENANLSAIPPGGTPAYMAPEMARGDKQRIGPASDIYLLGAVLYEIIEGSPPHRANNAADCIRCAAENRIEIPSQGGELAGIALKAMATEPAERYREVQDFQQAIREFRSHAESHRLCERARKIACDAHEDWNYETFGLAIATYQEALKVWAKNDNAQRESIQTRVAYAECACDKGDLDLAESLLTAAKALDSPVGEKLRRLKEQRKNVAAEQLELLAKVEKWTAAFLASPDCVLITRLADGTILEANDVFLRTMECSRDDVVGKSASQLNNWVDLSDRESFVRQLQQSGECSHLQTRFRTFSGEILPMDLSGRILTVDDETAVISHARNLSSVKRAENELREAQAREASLRKVVDSMSNAMLIIGNCGAVLDCNPSACSLLQMSRQQVLATSGLELLSRWDLSGEQVEEHLRLAASGETQILHCRFERSNPQSGNWAELRMSELVYNNTAAILCVVTFDLISR